ncbi:MAG: putative lipid II flippase FtsW [bacterium]|nr:putative lipid II flippase FtsW [bacterium]
MVKQKNSFDYILLGLIGAILVIGLVMLWSASTVESEKNFGYSSYYIVHQLLYGVGIGGLALIILSRIDYHVWQKFIPVALVVSLIALVLVKIPGIGFSANGATRWISLGPIFFQPAEVAKLSVILYLAAWSSTRGSHKSFFQSVFPPLVMVGLICLLILWQPDMGTMISIILTAMIMFFVGGIQLRYFGGLIVTGFFAMIALIQLEPYRVRRITAFLNRSIDPQGIGYQINQALVAVGTGGWFGYGYGYSRQKYFYLPEALNDSIFAVMAEELGLVRILLILGLFLFFLLRGIRVSLHAADSFGKMLALGIVAGIGANVIVNISAILGLVPLTGIPLPLFSYGSSSMIITLASLGILLNISRTAHKA